MVGDGYKFCRTTYFPVYNPTCTNYIKPIMLRFDFKLLKIKSISKKESIQLKPTLRKFDGLIFVMARCVPS